MNTKFNKRKFGFFNFMCYASDDSLKVMSKLNAVALDEVCQLLLVKKKLEAIYSAQYHANIRVKDARDFIEELTSWMRKGSLPSVGIA